MRIIIERGLLKSISSQCFTAKLTDFLRKESDNGIVKVEPSEESVEVTITDGFIAEIIDAYTESFIAGLGMALGLKAALEKLSDKAQTISRRYLKEDKK